LNVCTEERTNAVRKSWVTPDNRLVRDAKRARDRQRSLACSDLDNEASIDVNIGVIVHVTTKDEWDLSNWVGKMGGKCQDVTRKSNDRGLGKRILSSVKDDVLNPSTIVGVLGEGHIDSVREGPHV